MDPVISRLSQIGAKGGALAMLAAVRGLRRLAAIRWRFWCSRS